MIRLTLPLFSDKASKQLGKKLIYKTKGNRSFLTRYNKPGGVTRFTPSASQVAKRAEYGALVELWQGLFPVELNYWNGLVKARNLKMSGWNLFLKEGGTPFIAKNGLVGYWSFDEIVAGLIPDLSDEGNDGTPKPLYPSNYPHLVPSKNAKMVNAGGFDGVDDYVLVNPDASLNPANYISVEAWVKRTGGAAGENYRTMVWKSGADWGDWWMSLDTNSDEWYFFLRDVEKSTVAYALPLNEWCHLVATYDGSHVRAFHNGNMVSEVVAAGNLQQTPANPLWIGQGPLTTRWFLGLIDEVRIYNRALTPTEIQRHYDLLS